MAITVTVPADTKTPGSAGHTSDHNLVSDALTALGNSAVNSAGDVMTGALTFAASSPATPAANRFSLHASAAGTPQYKNDSGMVSQVPGVQTDGTAFSLTNPTAQALISKQWSIPAGDANSGTVYCVEVSVSGVWQATANFNLGWQLDATVANFVIVGGSSFPAGNNYGGVFRFYLQVLTTGAGGTHRVYSDGTLSDTSAVRTPSNCVTLDAKNTGSIDTTAAHTLGITSFFNVSNASQTVNGGGSIFKRLGN